MSQTSSIMHARWPIAGEVDVMKIKSSDYLMNTAHDLRLRLKSRIAQTLSKVNQPIYYKQIFVTT